MKLISFDVGIRNLAYVILFLNKGNIQILDWNVLNLIDEPPISQCNAIVSHNILESKNRICGKKASFKKNTLCFCKTHAKKWAKSKNFILPDTKVLSLQKKTKEELIYLGKTWELFLETDSLSKTKMIEKIKEFLKTNMFEKIKQTKTNASDVDLITLGYSLKEKLDVLHSIHSIDRVIIENQISPIASRMKTLQGMIAQYYIMKDFENNTLIKFMSSSNKLKHLVKSTSSTTYKENKKNSVYFCDKFLNENEHLKPWKESMNQTKKDDLADCFLQAIYYLENEKLLTYAENLKINSVTIS